MSPNSRPGSVRTYPVEHERANQRREQRGLPEVVPHRLSNIVAAPSDRVSLRQLLDYPALNLEHLTYAGDTIEGAEPVDAELG